MPLARNFLRHEPRARGAGGAGRFTIPIVPKISMLNLTRVRGEAGVRAHEGSLFASRQTDWYAYIIHGRPLFPLRHPPPPGKLASRSVRLAEFNSVKMFLA